MKTSPLISIIIPFYNVEKYIAQCLDSIYNQDIPESDYEVICVNDASPDNSRNIVIEYQKKHSNLILVEHEYNKKLGSARNTGRSVAKGKYIWNVDSDDSIKPNCLKTLVKVCQEGDLDVLVFNFFHLKGEVENLNTAYPFPNSNICSGIDFLNNYCLDHMSEISPVWTQIYKKSFLDDANIFSPPINMGEDVPYTLKTLLLASRIKSIDYTAYVYRLNFTSLTGEVESKPNAEKLYEKCFLCTKYIIDILSLIPKKEYRIIAAYTAIGKYILSLLPLYFDKMDVNERVKFVKICRQHFINDVIKLYPVFNKRRFVYYFKLIIGLNNCF